MSMRLRMMLIACLGVLAAGGRLAVADPATQPSATRPAGNLAAARGIIAGLDGMWTSVHEAMDQKDYATAEEVSGKMLAQRQVLADAARGTSIEQLTGMGFDQLDSFHKALADKKGEKAQTLMAGIDKMGEATMKILNPED